MKPSSVKKLIVFTLITLISSLCLSSVGSITLAYDLTNNNQGKVITSKSVDTSIPDRFKPSDNKDIKYRLEVLPYEEYRYHDQYLVIPAMGLVAPIMEVDKTSADYKNAIKWKGFDYNKYLEGWPLIYPGTPGIGENGNTFIFGHSNYRHNKPWKFKTIFRLTYNIEKNDKIRVYKKFEWKWVFFEYTVTMSQKVWAKDVRIISPEKWKNTITLSWCWPIGTARDRWMNRGELTYMEELDKVLKPIIPKPVPSTIKPKSPTKIKKSKKILRIDIPSKSQVLLNTASAQSRGGI